MLPRSCVARHQNRALPPRAQAPVAPPGHANGTAQHGWTQHHSAPAQPVTPQQRFHGIAGASLDSLGGQTPSLDALSPASSRPLEGRRILVTAPRQYAAKLCGLLVAAGAHPLWVPCIEITAVETREEVEALTAALTDLAAHSHIAFTSKNGIHAVLQCLESIHGGADAAREAVVASGVRICALGADALVLEGAGYPVHVLPEEASTQGLVRELVARGEADGARVLCPVPNVTGGLSQPPVVPRFLAALEAAGATPTRVDAYTTRQGVSANDISPEAALMGAGCVSAIVFTSTAEAQGLVNSLGGADVLQNLATDKGIALAAHGPYTAAGVEAETGVSVDIVGAAFGSFHGVVTALEEFYRPAPATKK